jgi:hypothetical protein
MFLLIAALKDLIGCYYQWIIFKNRYGITNFWPVL